jgi:hypothetical protein
VCLGQQEWEVHGSDADSHLDLGFTFWPFLLRSAHVCVPTCILTCLSFCCRVQFVVWSSSSVRRAMLSKLQNLKMLFTCQETDYWWVKFITGRIRWVAYTTYICFMSVYLVFGYRWCINYWDYLKSNGIHQGWPTRPASAAALRRQQSARPMKVTDVSYIWKFVTN